MTWDALPAATWIGRTALRVTDLDGVVDFYRSVVGLELQTRTDATATLGAGGTPLSELERDADAAALAAVRDRLAAADTPGAERDGGIEVADPDDIRLRIRAKR